MRVLLIGKCPHDLNLQPVIFKIDYGAVATDGTKYT